jgi:hypothetical protein
MFEIAQNGAVTEIITKKVTIRIDPEQGTVDAGLVVGVIRGAGEFEIGEMSIVAMRVADKVAYVAEDGGVRIGIIDGIETKLDDLGPIDILVSSSAKAIKEVGPKVVVAMGGAEQLAKDLEVELKQEKRLKIKNEASLPVVLEVYKLG